MQSHLCLAMKAKDTGRIRVRIYRRPDPSNDDEPCWQKVTLKLKPVIGWEESPGEKLDPAVCEYCGADLNKSGAPC